MNLFFATSCLPHLPLADAVRELSDVGREAVKQGLIDEWGLQLCGGHGRGRVDNSLPRMLFGPLVRAHHAFDWRFASVPVWQDGELWRGLGGGEFIPRTIHPPMRLGDRGGGRRWIESAYEAIDESRIVGIEVMYPGYERVPGGMPLAIDVSHLNLHEDPSAALRHYGNERIVEIHVSSNDGTADQHRPLTADSFGLRWASERWASGTPLVLECAFRTMTFAERLQQVEILSEHA